MLGQDEIRGQVEKNRQPGFASTTRPQIVKTNQYHVDIQDQNQEVNPDQILDVRIIGNKQIGAKDIIKIIKTKTGRPFSETTLVEDKRALMQKGWFIDVKPKVEKTPSGYIVTLQFIERPILHYVLVVGNKAHTRKILLEEANIKAGDALDPIAVHQAKERIEQFYRESGYYQINVHVLQGDKIGDRGAVYVISEGPKQRVNDVRFEGNNIASSQRLKTLIQSKPGWFFKINSEFTRKQLDEDVETLTSYYRKLGFFYAKIDRKFVETDSNWAPAWRQGRAWVDVKFVIEEGPRCRVRDVRFVGQKIFNQEQLRTMMKLPKEKYFNQDMLEADMKRVKDAYGEKGYVFARGEPDPRIDEDYVDLVINVREGPRCYLGSMKVEIVGNEGADPYTKWHPIFNRLSVQPGDILSTKEINDSKRRLNASQLFNTNPTQGQTPDIIFSYPEEAIEDEEREAAARPIVEPTGSEFRGQAAEPRRFFSPSWIFGEKPEALDEDEIMEPFKEYFRIRGPGQQPIHSGSLPYSVPDWVPLSTKTPRYSPMQVPIEPTDLSQWQVDSEYRHRFDVNEPIYRGQQFVQPKVYTPPYSTGTQTGQAAQPAAVQWPLGYSPGYSYTPTSGYTSQTMTGQTAPPVYTGPGATVSPGTYIPPSTGPAAISVAQNIPQAGFSVPSTNPYTGNTFGTPTTANGTANGSYQPQTYQPQTYPPQSTMPGTAVVLGNATDSAIGKSAYGFDHQNPTTKLYPADGTVIVQETRTGQLMMSVAVSSDSGLMGRFVIEEQNFDILNLPKGWRFQDWKNAFRGKGQRFRIEACPGTNVQRYSTSWETPFLFDLDYTFGVNGFYYQRYYDEWYEDRIGGAVSFGKLWTPDFSTRLSLGAQQVSIYRPINPTPRDLASALGHHPMYTIGLDATHNTRDSDFMPTEGHMASFGIEQVLGDYTFVRGSVDLRKYFMLHERPDRSGRWVLGLRSVLGLTEKGTPIYERYYGGGFTNLRGFEFRGVSPRDENGIIIGGGMEFYNSAELIFPITADDMIRGSVFVDSGTVERSFKNWEGKYRVAVGFGLRLTIPMMGPAPIALDFAFPISNQRGDDKQIFSFNVGFMR